MLYLEHIAYVTVALSVTQLISVDRLIYKRKENESSNKSKCVRIKIRKNVMRVYHVRFVVKHSRKLLVVYDLSIYKNIVGVKSEI